MTRHVLSDPDQPELPPVRALSMKVIFQAVRDAANKKDTLKALDAVLWLAGDDFPLFCEVAGREEVDGIQFIASGQVRAAAKLLNARRGVS